MSGSAERFVALLAGIVAILAGIGGMLRYLIKISWATGQLVQQFGEHVHRSDATHADQESRLRQLEGDRQRRRR